jgi:hydroxypyruvate reductase
LSIAHKPTYAAVLTRMRAHAEEIFRAGLRAAQPAAAIRRRCRLEDNRLLLDDIGFDLVLVERILVVGAGKATAAMAQAVEGLLGDRITAGLISVKYGHTRPLRRIETVEAGHPLPDASGLSASRRIMALLTGARSADLVLVLLSGGGSALLPLPAPGLSLEDKQAATDLLLAREATIQEINAVRKHLSAIKGGRLAQSAAPAALVTLALSDVVGDAPEVIASGPTVPDTTTFADCLAIMRKFAIEPLLPPRVRAHLEAGAAGRREETPKADTHGWSHTHHRIVGSNRLALEAAAREALALGYTPWIYSHQLEGDTHAAARDHAALARQILEGRGPVKPPACLLSGGETTLRLQGHGQGGRNQEFALTACPAIDGAEAVVLLSAGTDGSDGPTNAAGAFADHTSMQRAKQAGLDIQQHLANNDAYPFFQRLGDLLTTGPTGTNVMDMNVILIRAKKDKDMPCL